MIGYMPTALGEIVAAFPFEGKIMVFSKYHVYVHDPKDPDDEYTELPVKVKYNEPAQR